MPAALDWLATAEECFSDDHGCLRQGLLTSVFSLVVGLERIFHLDEMEDAGFARLCGGRRCPSRYRVGGWRRHLTWYEVDAFCRRTYPWHLVRNQHSLMSFDEHTIPRWTKKYRIGKGYVTTRNKYMRCEKLFSGYDLESRRFVTVRATPGNWGLQDLAVPLLDQVLQRGRPRSLHALFDAGAAGARLMQVRRQASDLVIQPPPGHRLRLVRVAQPARLVPNHVESVRHASETSLVRQGPPAPLMARIGERDQVSSKVPAVDR